MSKKKVKSVKRTVQFFAIIDADNGQRIQGTKLDKIFKKFLNFKDYRQRYFIENKRRFFVEVDDHKLNGMKKCRFSYTQTADHPRKEFMGKKEGLDFRAKGGEMEGLNYQQHFVVWSDGVVAVERNGRILSVSKLEEYFEDKIEKRVHFAPLLDGNAVAKLSKMKEIRSANIKVAGHQIRDEKVKSQDSMAQAAKSIADISDCETLEIVMSMGKSIGSLKNKGKIISFFKSIKKKFAGKDIKALKIKGITDDENKVQEIDLLSDMIVGNVSLLRLTEIESVVDSEYAYSEILKLRKTKRLEISRAI